MGKKIFGVLVIGLVLTLLIPIGSAKTQPLESHLSAVGIIQIDSFDHEIRGFVFFGINDGEVLILKNINIKYDAASQIMVGGIIPFIVHHINYNPAE